MKCHRYVAVSLIIVFVMIGMYLVQSIESVTAQSTQSYTGLDIVFLIDQSGSTVKSDPGDLRFRGPEFAIEWLGWTLLAYDPTHKLSFRVALVDFGDSAQVALAPYNIFPSDEIEWGNEFAKLKSQIDVSKRPQGTLGGTNFLVALEKARELFDQMEQDDMGKRLKAIVLLTDGRAEVYTETSEQHMKRLEAYIADKLPSPEYRMYVLGMHNPEEKIYWSEVRDHWERVTVNHAKLVKDNLTLGSEMQEILGDRGKELGIIPESRVECGPITVPPFLDQIRLTVHKPSADARVLIYDVAGRLLTPPEDTSPPDLGDSSLYRSGLGTAIELITVYDPQPGVWRIECPSGLPESPPIFRFDVQVKSAPTLPSTNLTLLMPYVFKYEVFTHAGQHKNPYPDGAYALQIQVTIGAGETAEHVDLVWQADEGSYSGTYVPHNVVNQYPLRLTALTHGPNGQVITLADDQSTRITVQRPTMDIVIPVEKWEQSQPCTFDVIVLDSMGNAFAIASGYDIVVEASAKVDDHEYPVSIEVVDGSHFKGEFVPKLGGPATISLQVITIRRETKETIVLVDQELRDLRVAEEGPYELDKETLLLIGLSICLLLAVAGVVVWATNKHFTRVRNRGYLVLWDQDFRNSKDTSEPIGYGRVFQLEGREKQRHSWSPQGDSPVLHVAIYQPRSYTESDPIRVNVTVQVKPRGFPLFKKRTIKAGEALRIRDSFRLELVTTLPPGVAVDEDSHVGVRASERPATTARRKPTWDDN